MAEGFTYSKAQSILTSHITSGTYVGLSSTTPTKTGSNFTELSTTYGYKRAAFGPVSTQKEAQVANKEIIFFFVALGDCGSATHVGFFSTKEAATPFLIAQLESPMTIGENYVPLIREYKCIIGLDVTSLDTNYTTEE